jgi:[protein-PII] uridylyltransferase
MEEVCRALEAVLKQPELSPPSFRRIWRDVKPDAGPKLPTRVVIDNYTAQGMTIIDVFAHDRLGLLYTISRALYDLRLNVHIAKIATSLDQVVDVFYVTDLDTGEKIQDAERCATINSRLLAAIGHLELGNDSAAKS